MPTALDLDTRAVVRALDDAVVTSRLTAADFAYALGTSASRLSLYRSGKSACSAAFLRRAERVAAGLSAAYSTRRPTMLTAAEAIRESLGGTPDPRWTLALALEARDRCREALALNAGLEGAWEPRPFTSDIRWDTLLMALTRHEFGPDRDAGLGGSSAPGPGSRWLKPLDPSWAPAASAWRTPQESAALTPTWLSRYGIVLAEPDLATS